MTDRERLEQEAFGKLGGPITDSNNQGAFNVIERLKKLFQLPDVAAVEWPGCGISSTAGGIVLNIQKIQQIAAKTEQRMDDLGAANGVIYIFDPSSVFWYGVAHEIAHQLQATKTAWKEMKANPKPHEAGADYLAGFVLGWLAADEDINFLNVIEVAWDLGLAPPLATTHPDNSQRKKAVAVGVSAGANAYQQLHGDETQLSIARLLDDSYLVASSVLGGSS